MQGFQQGVTCSFSSQTRLNLFFLINRQLQIVLEGKSLQECLDNVGVPQNFIIGPTLFLLYINGSTRHCSLGQEVAC